MAARLDNGDVRLLTRTGLDWTTKYPTIAKALAELPATAAYLDGELCGMLPDGRTAFNLIQNAADTRNTSLVFFLFDLLFLDGENLLGLPLIERKDRLKTLLADAPSCLQFTDHHIGHGAAVHRLACEHGLEGIVSKRVNGPCSAALWMRSSGDLDESPVSRRDHDCRSVIVAQEGSRGFNFRGATIRWRS
jgi:bifunctional non-homologous end joining protein LigD